MALNRSQPIGRMDFLGIGFTPMSLDAAAERIGARAQAEGAFSYIVMPNLQHAVGLDREPVTHAGLYSDCWLALNSSRTFSFLARLSGASLPALNGADLAETLLKRVIGPDDSVAIIGADAKLVAAVAARHRLNKVLWRPAPKGALSEAIDGIGAFIARARPRYTFLCLESPEQEVIARAVMQRGDATGVAICLGDSLQTIGQRMVHKTGWQTRDAGRRMFRPRGSFDAFGAVLDGFRVLPIWRYWLCARWERASISARRAF